ncbi:hypothetical protein FRC06_009008 [Ceratobasidium sp. 370]|nr:hypothetical protein FRC06_009008 [Ceratobasidium sp. 370]
MPQEITKKRKFDAGWSSSSVSTYRDIEEFQSDLKRCDASAIIQGLCDTLNDIPHENLRILRQILDPLLEADAGPKNCVRCHQSFYEAENTDKSCVVRCGSPERTSYPDEEYDQYYMVQTPCCKRLHSEADLSGLDSDDEDLICYRAKHTTNPKSVKYFGSSREWEEEGLNYWGRNKSVRTCSRMGCGGQNDKSDRQLKRRKRAPTPYAH